MTWSHSKAIRFGLPRRSQRACPFSASISAGEKPCSRRMSSLCSPNLAGAPAISGGVREKRGAGAGCGAPSTSMKGAARDIVGMARRLVEVEHRRDAGVAIGKQRRPIVAPTRGERRFEPRPHRRPGARVPAVGERVRFEPEPIDQRGEELRLQRADGDPFAVGAAVDAVERRAAVERRWPAARHARGHAPSACRSSPSAG